MQKPTAKIIPIAEKQTEKSLFGYMKDSVLIHKDILKPIGENWEVEKLRRRKCVSQEKNVLHD